MTAAGEGRARRAARERGCTARSRAEARREGKAARHRASAPLRLLALVVLVDLAAATAVHALNVCAPARHAAQRSAAIAGHCHAAAAAGTEQAHARGGGSPGPAPTGPPVADAPACCAPIVALVAETSPRTGLADAVDAVVVAAAAAVACPVGRRVLPPEARDVRIERPPPGTRGGSTLRASRCVRQL